jgi:8-oxo-dGTP diphosphatase
MTSPPEETQGEWSRPLAVAIDAVAVSIRDGHLTALLIRRTRAPFAGHWCLPGAFVGPEESLEAAARRVVETRAGLDGVYLEQLYSFGSPARDPRGRVVTVAYLALVAPHTLASWQPPSAACFAELNVPWAGEAGGAINARVGGSDLATGFDHAEILGVAVKRLRGKLGYTPVAYAFLPSTFTLRALRRVHQCIAGRRFNKDSFRRTVLASGELTATGRREARVGHRPAELYRHTPSLSFERPPHG